MKFGCSKLRSAGVRHNKGGTDYEKTDDKVVDDFVLRGDVDYYNQSILLKNKKVKE